MSKCCFAASNTQAYDARLQAWLFRLSWDLCASRKRIYRKQQKTTGGYVGFGQVLDDICQKNMSLSLQLTSHLTNKFLVHEKSSLADSSNNIQRALMESEMKRKVQVSQRKLLRLTMTMINSNSLNTDHIFHNTKLMMFFFLRLYFLGSSSKLNCFMLH